MMLPITTTVKGVAAPEGTFDSMSGTYFNRVLKRAYIRKLKAYGLRLDVVKKLKELNCKTIVFEAYGTSLQGPVIFVQSVDFEKFLKFSQTLAVGSTEKRHYLNISYWDIVGTGKVPKDFFE